MGRQSGQKGWQAQWQANGDGQGQYWDYWHGAWPGKWDKQKGAGKSAGKDGGKTDFPKYCEMKVTNKDHAAKEADAPNHTAATAMEIGDPKQDFLKAMQRALNANRKLEGRARKLAEEKARKEQMWEEYETKLKASYLEQLQVFQDDMRKLDGEMEQVRLQREEAMQTVTSLAESGEAPARLQEDPPRAITAEQEDSWQKLLATRPWREVQEDSWADAGAGGKGQATASTALARELRESSMAQDDLFRVSLRAMQKEIAEMKAKNAVDASKSLDTPERKSRAGLDLTPPPTARTQPRTTNPTCEPPVKVARRAEFVNAPPPHECYVNVGQAPMKDPYMASPSSTTKAPSVAGTPTKDNQGFGPLRVGKRGVSRTVEGPLPGLTAEADGRCPESADSSLAGKSLPQILDDDEDDKMSAASLVELGKME